MINNNNDININLKATNMDLTETISDYVGKRITNLGKLLGNIKAGGINVSVHFEVAKTTNHHKNGNVFRAECNISIDGKQFFGSAEAEDLYVAIDEVKDKLFNDIKRYQDRKQTLFKRGAASVKKMLKGISNRNPFTSKY